MPKSPLPLYTPIMILKTLGTGANRPMLVRAITEDGVRNDVVVKLIASERMNADRSLRELVGSFMALRIGLNAPAPCLTVIDEAAKKLAANAVDSARLSASQGLNFSSLYVEDLIQRVESDVLPNRLRDEALKVFFFDLLIQNPDRTIGPGGKTNLFTTGNDLWVLDHELAFSFLDLLFTPALSWQLSASDLDGFVKRHVLYAPWKGKQLDFTVLDGILDPLDEAFWIQIRTLLPSGWPAERLREITAHVNLVRQNIVLFTNNINKFWYEGFSISTLTVSSRSGSGRICQRRPCCF